MCFCLEQPQVQNNYVSYGFGFTLFLNNFNLTFRKSDIIYDISQVNFASSCKKALTAFGSITVIYAMDCLMTVLYCGIVKVETSIGLVSLKPIF